MTAKRWLEAIVVSLLVGALVGVLLPAVRTTESGIGGPKIPEDEPTESRRMTNGSGLSMVVPHGWSELQTPNSTEPSLAMFSGGTGRVRSKIEVSGPIEEVPADFTGFHDLTLAGHPANARVFVDPRRLTDKPYTDYEAYVERADGWWYVYCLIQGQYDTLPDRLFRYIETIQLPPLPPVEETK